MSNRKSARRRKRIIKTCIIIAALLITTIVLEWIVLVKTDIFLNLDKRINGQWTYQVDITDEAAVGIAMWMSDVQAADVNVDGVYDICGQQLLDVTWSFDMESGTYKVEVSEEDYSIARDTAYTQAAKLLEKLTTDRIEYAGIDMELVGEDVESLIQDTLGMNTKDFLINQAPDIFPSYEKLCEQYAQSGNYSCDGNTIHLFTLDQETLDMVAVLQENTLVLNNQDGGIVICLNREAD